ncbi:MAG TPA: hypothetical protein VLY63_20805 [Anaerolineae bacterium]|nr:hypothetical protein [Anaerolineae bacterium]
MKRLSEIINRLFGSLPGLLLVAVAWDALIVASLTPFSGPLRPLGLTELLGVDLGDAQRVGRIIMLYHSLAMPFVAALVYLVLDQVPMGGSPEEEQRIRRSIVVPITAGYMLTSIGGMTFGYGGRNWIAHGLYLVGLSLVFYAGILLAIALWPSKRWAPDPARLAHLGGVPLERLAFFLVAVFTLVSAAIGGAAGAFFGNGFEAFLAEDIVRVDPHTTFQLMIIAHLHIMLTLIDVMILLLIIRTYRVEGRVHKIAVPFTIIGTLIVTFATWSVIGWEGAHKVINIGSAFLLPGAILVAIWGFAKLMGERVGSGRASIGQKLRALLHDPVRFGIFFELIFVNLVVTVPGVYVAFNLETYRTPAYLAVERTILVGHWHVLATLSAVIVLFLIADRLDIKGWVRQVVGWGLLAGSTLSFLFVNVYMFRQPGQEKLWTVPFFEAGIALSLLALATFVAVLLVDQIKQT